MASIHLTAYVEGEAPHMTIDLVMDRPDIYLHDEDSERTFLYEAIVAIAAEIKETLLLEIEG